MGALFKEMKADVAGVKCRYPTGATVRHTNAVAAPHRGRANSARSPRSCNCQIPERGTRCLNPVDSVSIMATVRLGYRVARGVPSGEGGKEDGGAGVT